MDTQKIFDTMAQEGFRPSFDEDGDISFKFEGKNMVIIFDPKDENYLSLGANFSGFDSNDFAKAKEVAHSLTKEYKAGKCFVLKDDEDDSFRVRFVIEIFTSPELFARDVVRFLDIISDMITDFMKQMESTQNDSGRPWQ